MVAVMMEKSLENGIQMINISKHFLGSLQKQLAFEMYDCIDPQVRNDVSQFLAVLRSVLHLL